MSKLKKEYEQEFDRWPRGMENTSGRWIHMKNRTEF